MKLRNPRHILKIWQYAIEQGANVVLMRHGPKSGSNDSGLSEQGKVIVQQYGGVLKSLGSVWLNHALLYHTEKPRTLETLCLLFPESNPTLYHTLPKLNSQLISAGLQEQVNRFHLLKGRWLGYYLNHTYCLLESLGGTFPADSPEECLDHIATEAADGVKELLALNRQVLFCGHSPKLELGTAELLGRNMLELGGFLNPLDSFHLRFNHGRAKLVVRVNPILDYVDLESEGYLEGGEA